MTEINQEIIMRHDPISMATDALALFVRLSLSMNIHLRAVYLCQLAHIAQVRAPLIQLESRWCSRPHCHRVIIQIGGITHRLVFRMMMIAMNIMFKLALRVILVMLVLKLLRMSGRLRGLLPDTTTVASQSL